MQHSRQKADAPFGQVMDECRKLVIPLRAKASQAGGGSRC